MKSRPHSKETRADTAVVRNLTPDSRTACSVHNESSVSFGPTDFDICCLLSSKYIGCLMGVVIDKSLYTDSDCPTVIGDLLGRYIDTVKTFQ